MHLYADAAAGIAKYYRAESMNELKHAHGIVDYITQRSRVYRLRRLHEFLPSEVNPKVWPCNALRTRGMEGEVSPAYCAIQAAASV